MSGAPSTAAAGPSLAQFALLMVRIGLTSFGGGMSGWMLRLVVQDRGWISEQEFLAGLGVCQVFPGVNVVNIAIWLGYRFHGNLGAVVGPAAIVLPPAVLLITLAELVLGVSQSGWARLALNGVAAAAIGLGAAMGFRAARRCLDLVPAAVMAATFAAVALLHVPLVWVLLVLCPVSVAHAWRMR